MVQRLRTVTENTDRHTSFLTSVQTEDRGNVASTKWLQTRPLRLFMLGTAPETTDLTQHELYFSV